MSQQQDAREQDTAVIGVQKSPEAEIKEVPLSDEQNSFITSNLPFVLTGEAPWLRPEEFGWVRYNATNKQVGEALKIPQGHPSSLEWQIRIMGKRLIPEDKQNIGSSQLTDEQKKFISANLPAVIARQAPWLTPEEAQWIRHNSTSEAEKWALQNPPGCPTLPEWRVKLIGKRLIPEDETGDETTFKRSDLGGLYRVNPEIDKVYWVTRRITVKTSPSRIAKSVSYG